MTLLDTFEFGMVTMRMAMNQMTERAETSSTRMIRSSRSVPVCDAIHLP